MSKRMTGCALLFLTLGVVPGFGQAREENKVLPDNPQSLAHVETARKLAGADLTAPFNFYCVPGKARGTDDNAPELEPIKLFDNLYAVGNSETTVYALPTSEGIILIDSGFADRVETVLVPGLKKLGLDPANVKYVLLAHGHADHFGGASYFQNHYGAKIYMAAVDWDMVEKQAASAKADAPKPPKRDMVITDGQPIRLGDTSVMPVWIPGHTPGSMAFIFPVRDGGTAHIAGLFGGTMLSSFLRSPTPGVRQYIDSINRYLEVAGRMKVDVGIQNHPIFDDMPARIAMLKTRKPGEANPFVIGTGRHERFWKIIAECMQAEIARRGDGK